MICYMVFTINGQTKAAAAFEDNFGIYAPILFKLCVQVAYCSLGQPDFLADSPVTFFGVPWGLCMSGPQEDLDQGGLFLLW